MAKNVLTNKPQVSMKIYRLHLEMNTTGLPEEGWDILRKYGKVEKTISRDILVSDQITLHALHYVIQRLFGWQNCHMHRFTMPEQDSERVTEGKLSKWAQLCGLYFRYPSEELDDLFWDDDYDEEQDFKAWMKEKYTAPYVYGGMMEHYFAAQQEVQELKKLPTLTIAPSFEEYKAGKEDSREVAFEDATLKDMLLFFEDDPRNLLERLTIAEVLSPSPAEDVLDKVDAILQDIRENADWIQEQGEKMMTMSATLEDMAWEEMENMKPEEQQEFMKKAMALDELCMALFRKTDRTMPALSSELLYEYDFGDNWEVKITCEVAARLHAWDDETVTGSDGSGKVLEEKELQKYADLLMSGVPLCVAADGLPVMDDAGGLWGYVDFLKGIHGQENDGPYENKEEARAWGKSMGWTGRMKEPKNML